ncbi:MAG: hypothetical protein GOVbin4206_76 [Prokaryotic dsDNA virus sp.]|nr:MAG: hypothetical protein GOVbin4206_76 [Prokaryotic dsDNA virus sp.]|tara:strand:- start:1741 stop:2157 length:417 start_codon:yes stop_codon:yes gene_type:complete
MPERMTKEEAKIQRAIRAARIAKQTLLEENRDRMPLEVDEEEVKVKRPKAENVTIKVPNQDKEGYGLAGVEEEYKIKKAEKEIIGYDVIYFKDGKREVESFRNLKKIPTKRGRSIPDIQPVKVFAIKNDANTIKTIYK